MVKPETMKDRAVKTDADKTVVTDNSDKTLVADNPEMKNYFCQSNLQLYV